MRTSSEVTEGYVIETDPAAGTSVDKGTTITVYVSDGPEAPQEVSVPGVVGDTAGNAKARLTSAGFKVIVSGPADGIVLYQSVTGTAPYGATITLTTEAVQTDPEPSTDPGNQGSGTGGQGSGTGSETGSGSESGSGTGTGSEGDTL